MDYEHEGYTLKIRELWRHYGDYAVFYDEFDEDTIFIHPEVYTFTPSVWRKMKKDWKLLKQEFLDKGFKAVYAYYFEGLEGQFPKLAKIFDAKYLDTLEAEGVPFYLYEVPLEEKT